MQIILAGSAKVYQMAAYFGLYNYCMAAAEIPNGANGGANGRANGRAWQRLWGLLELAPQFTLPDPAHTFRVREVY